MVTATKVAKMADINFKGLNEAAGLARTIHKSLFVARNGKDGLKDCCWL